MHSKRLHAALGLALAIVLALLGGDLSGAQSPDDADGVVTAAAGPAAPVGATVTTAANGAAVVVELPELTTTTTAPAPTTTVAPTTTTTAPPAPAPAPTSMEGIITSVFGDAAPRAIAIARCESRLDPNAVSRTNDHGLFQINAIHRGSFEAVTGAPWSSVYDPTLNTMFAKHLYDSSGWGPWACARKV